MEAILRKMHVENDDKVKYSLRVGAESFPMNPVIGMHFTLRFMNEIICLNCGNLTKKSFGQGYCYPCFKSIPETEECVLRPELCLAHEGIARDMDFAKSHCLIDHYVYLANTGVLKVGVTRHHQVPTRWIDQGATEAIILAKTPNRYLAGTIEVALKSILSDRTNWRKMLTGEAFPIDLLSEKDRIAELLPFDMQNYLDFDDNVVQIDYPVNKYPLKVKSINLDKTADVSGILTGIKGQYLIFDDGRVFNVRRHGGYKVEVEVG
jgi:hypothetical protein